MLSVPVLAAILAAVPSVLADYGSSTSPFVRCTTRFNTKPLPTGMDVPTTFEFDMTTQTYTVTTTFRETITIGPNTTACAGIMTTTSTVRVTQVTTPPAITVPTSPGQQPLVRAAPSEGLRHRTRRLVGRALDLGNYRIKRQTAYGNTAGLAVLPDGNREDLMKIYPSKVECMKRWTHNYTQTVTVTGAPTTVVRPTSSPTVAWTTTTVKTSITVVEEAPTPTVYAACGKNNVVNHIVDLNGTRMNFNRVVFEPEQGLPKQNSWVVNTTNAENCCRACQDTAKCVGSAYIPSKQECHLRVTNTNNTMPTNGTLTSGTGTAIPFPTSTGTPGTNNQCPLGSETYHIGTIRFMDPADFKDEYAMYLSNGPCGWYSIDPNRLGPDGEEVSQD